MNLTKFAEILGVAATINATLTDIVALYSAGKIDDAELDRRLDAVKAEFGAESDDALRRLQQRIAQLQSGD